MNLKNIIGGLLVLVGAFMLFWYAWGDAQLGTQWKVNNIKDDVEVVSADDIQENLEKTTVATQSDSENNGEPNTTTDENGSVQYNSDGVAVDENGYPISNDDSVTYDVSNIEYSTEPPTNGLNVSYTVGMIYVPDVGINEYIYEGLSNDNLWVGVGTVKPNQRMGERNYALAGHHMENPNLLFSPLMQSQKGQKIYLSDKQNVYEYEITDIVHVDPSQGHYILDSSGDEIVTLVTCTDPWGSERRVIQGKLTNEMSLDDAPNHVQNSFN